MSLSCETSYLPPKYVKFVNPYVDMNYGGNFLTSSLDRAFLANFVNIEKQVLPLIHYNTIPLIRYNTIPLIHYNTIPLIHFNSVEIGFPSGIAT